MSKLHSYFPWMTDEQVEILRQKLLAETAETYEKAELWGDAARCWARWGDVERAAGLYGRVGDWGAAGKVLLLAGKFEAAREVYGKWEEEAGEDGLLRVTALLGQAACEIMANEEEWVVPDSYREARALVDAGLGRDVITNAKGWAAIAAHGALVGRFDLLHMGYERALKRLTDEVDGDYAQRMAIGEAYLAAATQYDDRLLVKSIKKRLAKWKIAAQEPAWMRWKVQIQDYPFREGVRNVLHFSDEAQLEAWQELAHLDPSAGSGHRKLDVREQPEVDEYLRTLAPPDMVYIPAGMFLMGSADDDPDARDDEKPQHEVWLSGYYMSRYPITNEKYGAFMKDGGYQQADYWREAAALGWWEEGKYQGRYTRSSQSEPHFWRDERRNQPKQPVVGISWHEALAYCRWAGVDLPTEAQWEKAAGWDAGEKRMRRYPWGDEYDENKVQPIRHKRSEVGHFCDGELNYYGLSDMTGLYHWCRSRYQPYPSTVPEPAVRRACRGVEGGSGTPYQSDKVHEELEGRDRRVVRGFWVYNLNLMRCRSRDRLTPSSNRIDDVGFRPVWNNALVLNSDS